MSLDKAIQHGKEHRKGYRERGKPGECDPTCRPHGGGNGWPCPWCERSRLLPRRLLEAEAAEQIDEALSQGGDDGNLEPIDIDLPTEDQEEGGRPIGGYERLPCGCIRVYPWLRCRHGN